MPNKNNTSRIRANITKTILAGSLSVAMVPAWSGLDLMLADSNPTDTGTSLQFVHINKAYADETNKDASTTSKSHKDETVYVKTDASGQVLGVYVVNRFEAGSGTVKDPANYQNITNMTTPDTLKQKDGAVSILLQENDPFYYEGQMASDVALPWNVNITYYLNGKEINVTELGGVTGNLRIELTVTARTNAPEAGLSDFANSYVLQAQGTFDSASFEMKEDESLMVAQVGSEAVVNCMVLPGESKTFVLEGTANNFTSSGWQISALPLALAIDIAEQDTSELTNATSQLNNATDKLASGSAALSKGMDEAVAGVSELLKGSDTFTNGIAELSAGMSELVNNNAALLDGWNKIKKGTAELSAGTSTLAEGGATFRSTVENAQSEMKAALTLEGFATSMYEGALEGYVNNPTEENKSKLNNALSALASINQARGADQALTEVLSGYSQLEAGITAVNDGAATLASGTTEFDEYLNLYLSGVTTANSGITALSEGAAQLIAGTNELSSGASDLQSGAQALANGSAQLAASVKGMDKQLLDGIQAAIDEKLGADFELHSFVVPENTHVDSVQFVYMVDGASPQAAVDSVETPTEETTEEPGLIQRFFMWIKGLFA